MFDRLRSIFSWTSSPLIQKANPVGSILSRNKVGKPQFMQESYMAFSEEGYKKNVIVKRSIETVAQAFAHLPFVLERRSASGKRKRLDDPNHPLARLWNRPNPWQGGAQFWEAFVAYIMIKGDSYLMGNGAMDLGENPNAVPSELWLPRPDRMKIIPGDKGLPQTYRFEMQDYRKDFPVDQDTAESQIFHYKTFNPTDDWYGLPVLKAAAMNVDCANAGAEWNMQVLQNSGRPAGAMVYKPGGENEGAALTRSQRQTLEDEIERKIINPRNARRPLILDGGVEWEEMSMSAQELDWLEGLRDQYRYISLAFGVPALCLGLPGDNTYANYDRAMLALYEETVIPLSDRLLDAINGWLTVRFDDSLQIVVDKSQVTQLAPRRKEIFDQVNTSTFHTPNEKREAMGMESLEAPEADLVWMPSTLVPLENPDEEDGDEDDTVNTSESENLATQALAGQQIQALQQILDDLISKKIPPDAARILILASFPTLDPDAVDALLESVEDFEPPPPEPGMDADGNPLPALPTPGGAAPAPKPVVKPPPKAVAKGVQRLLTYRRPTTPVEVKGAEFTRLLRDLGKNIVAIETKAEPEKETT